MNSLIQQIIRSFRNAPGRSGRGRRRSAPFQPAAVVATDLLESRLMMTSDFGDAPDTSPTTGPNNYQTLVANGGASHVIDNSRTKLYLGAGVDGESAALQSPSANLDDNFAAGGRDDEDGVVNPLDLQATVGGSASVTMLATNTTGKEATLYGWIDFNRNGIFETTTERARVFVPDGTVNGRMTLVFPTTPAGSAGQTYARFRLSTDVTAANPVGIATDGEVEDYRFAIQNRLKLPMEITQIATFGEDVAPITQESPYSLLGWDVTPIGDLDQDGVADLVVTDPQDGLNLGSDGARGAIYVTFLNSNGSVKRSVKIGHNLNGGPELNADDYFGGGVTAIGDLDGDGTIEIAVGAFGDDTGGTDRGAVYILRLKPDGTVKSSTKIASGLNGGPAVGDSDDFGMFLTSPGDLDGDGVPELTVAATAAEVGGTERGVIYNLFLRPDGTVRSVATIENTSAWNSTVADDDSFGSRVTAIGDVDGDGIGDLATLTATNYVQEDYVESLPTRVEILKLNADGTLKSAVRIASGLRGAPTLAADEAIWDVTSMGDVDADGVDDLAILVGNGVSRSSQKIYQLLMNPDLSVKRAESITLTHVTSLATLMNVGDLNNDGKVDLAWGLPLDGTIGMYRGVVKIISLQSAVPNTAVPSVPVVNRTIAATRSRRPQFQWNENSAATSYDIWLQNRTTGAVILSSAAWNTNSFTPPSDLQPGKYNIQIRARNEIGKSGWSTPYLLTIINAVQTNPVPSGMRRKPEITWAALPDASKYEVWIAAAATPAVSLVRATTPVGATRFVPASDLASGNYVFYVRGVKADGSFLPWSESRSFTIAAKTSITGVTRQFTNRPIVTWGALPGADKYEIWINNLSTPSKPAIRLTTASGVTTYAPSTMPSGRYRIWVRGVTADGALGEWSASRDFASGQGLTFLPVTGTVSAGSSVTVSWVHSETVSRYEVWVDDPAPGLTSAATIKPVTSGNSYSFDLKLQGTYRVWVRAITTDGTVGVWSVAQEIQVLDKVRGVSFNSVELVRPEIRWTSLPGALKYEVRVVDTNNTVAPILKTVNAATGSTQTYQLDNELPIGSYQFSVRVIVANEVAGPWSEPVAYRSHLAPQLLAVQPTTNPDVTFEWTSPENATGHLVVIKNVNAQYTAYSVATAQGISSLVRALPDGHYQWWVRSNAEMMWSLPGTFEVKRFIELTSNLSFPSGSGVTLKWTSVIGADHYDLWVTDTWGNLIYRNQSVSGLQLTLPSSLNLAPGGYRTWVRAVSASGYAGAWSTRRDFSFGTINT